MRFELVSIAVLAIILICPQVSPVSSQGDYYLGSNDDDLKLSDFLGYDLPQRESLPKERNDDDEEEDADDYDLNANDVEAVDEDLKFLRRTLNNGDVSDDEEDDDELFTDVAVKLKKEYGDDLVSELFALSHGLIRVARVTEIDDDGEHTLFHFKLTNIPFDSEDMHQPGNDVHSHRHHRAKRHVENKIESLRADDRVVYVLPQRMLKREKRGVLRDLSDYLAASSSYEDERPYENANVYKRKLYQLLGDNSQRAGGANDDNENVILEDYVSRSDLDYLKENLYNILQDNSIKIEDRKKIYDLFKQQEVSESNDNSGFSKQLDQARTNIEKSINSQSLPSVLNFNDKKYNQEWYLINNGQFNTPPSHDLNVKEAWLRGYTGKNKTIVIVDDGIDHEHPDFEGKYRPDLSYDYNDENDTAHDPMPSTFDDQNNHGTRCAGAAAANANNSVCGVGIAYDAQIAGIRILDGPITDLLEARALSYKASEVDIRSASWGPKDDGAHMEYPGKFVNLALEEGVKHGRNGKGTLYVWATGNGGGNDDDCACDGYVSHWDIISIGSVNHRGLRPYFMELCPSTMAVVYSGGQTKTSADSDDPGVRVVASDVRGKCTTKFQGTSSAAPLAAGAFALVLEANPNLTYRDVMHLIARTSRIPNIEDTDGWIVNGANYHVNEKYGFGVLDVSKMIQEALTWVNVPERQKCVVKYNGKLPKLGKNSKIEVDLEVSESDCPNVQVLEHTIANISFSYTSRGDVKLTVISPSNTPSEMLSFRKNDRSRKGTNNFPFMSVFNWGESPVGKWRLIIETRTRAGEMPNHGSLDRFSFTFFGSKKQHEKKNGEKEEETEEANTKRANAHLQTPNQMASVPSFDDLEGIYNSELKVAREIRLFDKRVAEKRGSR